MLKIKKHMISLVFCLIPNEMKSDFVYRLLSSIFISAFSLYRQSASLAVHAVLVLNFPSKCYNCNEEQCLNFGIMMFRVT